MQPGQFKQLSRKGQTVLRMRPAWTSYWRSGLAVVVVTGLWLVQRELFDGLAQRLGIPIEFSGLGLAIALFPILAGVVYHRYTHAYEIENGRKLRLLAGFISRVKREFPLTDKVQTDMGQTIAGRLLNYGTIAFWTGDDRSRLVWAKVSDPDRVIAYLDLLKAGAQGTTHAPAAPQAGETAWPVSRLPEPPTLKEAKSTKVTHFGRSVEYKNIKDMVARRIRTPFGDYIDNDDGTVSHADSGLMWLRAPWGMVWTGSGFAGEPIRMRWSDAADLFGVGTAVGYNVGSTMAYMGSAKRAASAFEHGYRKGKCVIDAAGYTDWRLPTAVELDRFVPFHHRRDEDMSEAEAAMSQDDAYLWGWKGKASFAVARRLYPELFETNVHLWTATGLGGGLAWAYDGSMPAGDHEVGSLMGALFVRRLTGGEFQAPTTIDEDVSW